MTAVNPDAGRLIDLLAERAISADAWAGTNWDRLIALARQNGLAPFLFAQLKARGLPAPPNAAEQLRQLYLASATRNLRLFRELGEILRAVQAEGIPVIPLKGACLAETVYGNVALRPMGDVDLLVKRHDMARALDVLRTLGYEPEHAFDPVAEQAVSQHMPSLSKPGGLTVEMHWTLARPGNDPRVDADVLAPLWSNARPATIGGVSVLTFSPADLLLHLCLHASTHCYDGVGLRCYLDMAQVCARYGDAIDWKQFTTRANHWGVANGVRLALQLAGEWTAIAIPPAVLASLEAAPLDDATARWVRHKVLNGNCLALRCNMARLAGATRVTHGLRALFGAVFPSRIEMARIYPARADSWRILAYYPVRFKVLWQRYNTSLWQVARRDRTFMTDARHEMQLREYLGWH